MTAMQTNDSVHDESEADNNLGLYFVMFMAPTVLALVPWYCNCIRMLACLRKLCTIMVHG